MTPFDANSEEMIVLFTRQLPELKGLLFNENNQVPLLLQEVCFSFATNPIIFIVPLLKMHLDQTEKRLTTSKQD